MNVSDADLAIIREHGIPLNPGLEFVSFSESGAATFTERGRQVYRLALLLNGLDPEQFEQVKDREGLRELSLKIKRVRVMIATDEADRALKAGKISPRSREMYTAARNGSIEDLQMAIEKRIACESAGDNVIPAAFGKRN